MLRALGVAAAGAAAPRIAWGLGAEALPPRVRVAMLLPDSSAAASFRDGFVLAMHDAAGARFELTTHDIGSGVGRAMAFARAQRVRRAADVVVAMMSARAVPWVTGALAAAGIPLVAANAGERVVRDDAISPAVVHASLELSRAAYESGRWAATHAGTRCALSCSYYESGFDMVPAFRAGFEAAGGRVVLSLVAGAPAATRDAAEVARATVESGADVIAAFYTGEDAREFFTAYATIDDGRPVIASPLVTADEATGVALTSVAPWSPALDVPASRSFVASFAARFRRHADAFAMLGYDSAGMIRHAAGSRAGSLAGEWRLTGYGGTRGAVEIDPRTNEIGAGLLLRRLDGSGRESLVPLQVAQRGGPLASLLPQHHGWISTYMTA